MVILLNLLASIQFVWFYVSRVPSSLDLVAYEQGRERIPFQYRMLMVYPLRWAHTSSLLRIAAQTLTSLTGWFPTAVHPEGILQAVIYLLCVGVAGTVAQRLYRASSRTGILAPFVYPLNLIMIVSAYAMLTTHQLRFVYDLPSLAFFSAGLYLIYFRLHPILFCILFAVATLNRETSLLLLAFFVLARCSEHGHFDWRQIARPGCFMVLLPLSGYWLAWHVWVVRHFAVNPSGTSPRLGLNAWLLLIPLAWPQLLGLGSYLVPLIIVYRDRIPDSRIKAWMWVLPAWFGLMMVYGLIIEIRVFGELIPYLACTAALICEETLQIGRTPILTTPASV